MTSSHHDHHELSIVAINPTPWPREDDIDRHLRYQLQQQAFLAVYYPDIIFDIILDIWKNTISFFTSSSHDNRSIRIHGDWFFLRDMSTKTTKRRMQHLPPRTTTKLHNRENLSRSRIRIGCRDLFCGFVAVGDICRQRRFQDYIGAKVWKGEHRRAVL